MTEPRITQEMRQAVEAILMVSDQPVETNLLAQLLEAKQDVVEQICSDLAAEYRSEQRGFMLAKVAGGYRFQTVPDLAPYVERYVLEGQSARLSAAALETMAIVAYKQPISRMQVAAIRGVMSDGVIRTLEARGYVGEIERDSGPGNAILYGTTPLFLERLGIDSVAELPPLSEFMPETNVVEQLEATLRPSAIDPRDDLEEGDESTLAAVPSTPEHAEVAVSEDLVNEDLVDEDLVDEVAAIDLRDEAAVTQDVE